MPIKKQQGYTFVELVIGMALIALLMGAVFNVLHSSIRSNQYNFEAGSNIQDVRNTLNLITNEVRNATEITLPVLANSGNVLFYKVNTQDRKIYVDSNTNSVIIEHAGTVVHRLAVEKVESLNFTRDNVNTRKLSISLMVKNQNQTNAPSMQLSTVVMALNDIP